MDTPEENRTEIENRSELVRAIPRFSPMIFSFMEAVKNSVNDAEDAVLSLNKICKRIYG